MTLSLLDHSFAVCKVRDYSEVSLEKEFVFTAKTDDENSLVCPRQDIPQNAYMIDHGWCAFRIDGVLDFSLVGILAKISGILAEANVGIFALSTYNTDYIFVKEENFPRAARALMDKGYEFRISPSSRFFGAFID